MSSRRILIVRIHGIGYLADLAAPLTRTSRPGLSYLPATAIEGVVTGLSSQLSSEIALFDALGSDPTTSFSVLSNASTLSALLSRGAQVLRAANGSAVLTTAYLSRDPAPIVYVTSTATMVSGDVVRIGTSTIQVAAVLDAFSFSGTYVYGSTPVPIPLRDNGGGYEGATVYSLVKSGVQLALGGVEQLPIVISTADESATSEAGEEVIFRGFISRLSTDTSARGQNLIKVEAASMMGYLRTAPFRPVPYAMFLAYTFTAIGGEAVLWDPVAELLSSDNTRWFAVHRPELLGYPWDPLEPVAWDTRIGAFQCRKDSCGGVTDVEKIVPPPEYDSYYLLQLTASQVGVRDVEISGFNLMFKDGFYGLANAARLNVTLTEGALAGDGRGRSGPWESWSSVVNPEYFGEICFVSNSIPNLIIDLIFGTYQADFSGGEGVRAAGQSAALPFAWADADDLIDYPSLLAALGDARVASDIPALRFDGTNYVLPYEHSNVKTVGELLEKLLKGLGCFMVYDRGRFTFGSWASNGAWAREVNDTGLATPQISLQFDRLNAVRSAEAVRVLSLHDGEIVKVTRPVTNSAMVSASGGKIVTLQSFVVSDAPDTQVNAWRSAVATVLRYGQACAMVEVQYRNSVHDLSVGEAVSFSSAFVPSGAGTMGVFAAAGFVLKAARSWASPATSYTIVLPGYLYAASRPAYVSVSATIAIVDVGEDIIVVEDNDFTLPAGEALQGAPTSDWAAFTQARDRMGSPLPCQLVNANGTPYGVTAGLINVIGSTLFFDAPLTGAVAGDKIVLDGTYAFTLPALEASWDAFLANASGEVAGDVDLAVQWGAG